MKEKRGLQNIVTLRLWQKGEGIPPDQVVNLAVERGIPVWELREKGPGLQLSTAARWVRPFLRLARKNGCATKIVAKKGPGFVLGRIRRRKSLLVFSLLFFLLLFGATRFLWFVDIQCEDPRLALEVKHQLAAAGIMPGSLKNAYGSDYIRQVLEENPEIAWVGVDFQGSRLALEIIKRQDQREPSMAGGLDLIAKEAGEITEILVLQGEARVRPGDTVAQGQVLIAGYDPAQDSYSGENGQGTGREAGSRQRRARGVVRAKVSREIIASCPFLEEIPQDTGREVTWYQLVLENDKKGKNQSWRLNGLNQEPFDLYRQITSVRVLWQNKDGSKRLKLLTTTHKEQEIRYIQRTISQAAERCRELAYEELARAAGEDFRVLNEESEAIEDSGQGEVRLIFKVDTIELVAGAF